MEDYRRAVLALILALGLAGSGCAAFLGGAAVSAGAYTYEAGRFKTSYQQPYDRVYDATLASLKEMDMPVSQVQRDAAGADISANRADGTGVTVDLAKVGPSTTNAQIRVGWLGDENASRTIADNIAAKLGEKQREPTGRGGEQQPSGG